MKEDTVNLKTESAEDEVEKVVEKVVETVEEKTSIGELEKLQATEKILFAIDRQIITEGLRLVMILPAVIILFLFSSWHMLAHRPHGGW